MQEFSRSDILNQPPDRPDSSNRYLFYLHGLIVEVAGIRPKSEEHGYYEYEGILDALASKGFVVISEVRGKDTHVQSYARRIGEQVKSLMDNGVPADNIIIVGASKGGAIAAYVSSFLQEENISYFILAGLFEKYLEDENLKLYGKVLSIHDREDKLKITPQEYFQRSKGLGHFKEVVLDIKKGHGIIYQPYQEWLDPFMQWLDEN
ncbi:MAG: alpha/beta hydrolase [Desulfocapsaceae bacterium]|nr:alpha/beta hydrolase [Desulfocapsaceae bacterium]